MLVSTIFLVLILEAIARANLIAKPSPALIERAACNADNCLRVLTDTISAASTFCSTYIESTTAVTVTPTITVSGTSTISGSPLTISIFPTPTVPAHIASQCQLATSVPLPVRLSSACSCISVVPSTVTSTVVASTVTTTVPVEPTGPCTSLPNPYITTGGTAYTLYCGYVVMGGGLPFSGQVTTFEQCLDACSATEWCVAIGWVNVNGYPSDEACSLLGEYTTFLAADDIDSAVLVGAPPIP